MLKEAEFVIEAIVEDIKKKQSVFAELDKYADPEVMLASSTTSCSISEIAYTTKRSERVIGMHFFNPVHAMKLVEIMPGISTNLKVVSETVKFTQFLGKKPIVVRKDSIAGIASRVLAGLLNEAVWALEEGLGNVSDIDKCLKLGARLPMGPLELIDFIGIDTHFAKTKYMYEKLGDPRYRPCHLLEKMIYAGYLGRKSNKGFYDYSCDPSVPINFTIDM